MVVQGQTELCEFKAILVYIVRPVTVIRGWRDGTGVSSMYWSWSYRWL